MSNKPDPRTQLLAETFHGDWVDGAAGAFARQAAQAARSHRRRRQTVLLAGTVAALAAAFVFSRPPTASAPRVHPAGPAAPAYEVISDDDLIATLRDRPLLVTRKANGAKQIVVLSDTTNS